MGRRKVGTGSIVRLGIPLVVCLLFVAGPALCAGGHGGADRSADLLDLLYRFINFALLVIILFVVLRKVNIGGIFAARSQEIQNRMDSLRGAKEEAETRCRDLEKKVLEFERDRQGILDRYRAEGLAEKERVIKEAEERVKVILEQAEATMQREMESLKIRLRGDLVDLAAQKAEEILAREITDRDQDRLVDEFVERVGEEPLIESKVSKRYAKALFSLAKEDGKIREYGEDLNRFAGFCQDRPEFAQVIASRLFTLEDRKKILDTVLVRGTLAVMVRNFLHLLLDKGRIGFVGSVADYYRKLSDEAFNEARAEVIVPRPLKRDALLSLEKSLEKLTSKKVKVEVREDRSLIGGVVVRIGDLVLDGSVKAHLRGVRESL